MNAWKAAALVFFALGALSSCQNFETTAGLIVASKLPPGYGPANWMGALSDSVSLAQLSIPGTHETCARVEPWPGITKCQDLSLAEQLKAGIRFLDIRCRHVNDAFAIYHGPVYQNLSFTEVLTTCADFLAANPTECLVMSVKEESTAENNTVTFEQQFDRYVALNPSLWYAEAATPTLGVVRGKIVLFRRFDALEKPKGLDASNWPDNQADFTVDNGQQTLRVQDKYVVATNAEKWADASKLFQAAREGEPTTLYLSYTSGYRALLFGIPNITSVSNAINPQIETYFAAHTSGRFGIVPMDFVNEARTLMILNTNFSPGRQM